MDPSGDQVGLSSIAASSVSLHDAPPGNAAIHTSFCSASLSVKAIISPNGDHEVSHAEYASQIRVGVRLLVVQPEHRSPLA